MNTSHKAPHADYTTALNPSPTTKDDMTTPPPPPPTLSLWSQAALIIDIIATIAMICAIIFDFHEGITWQREHPNEQGGVDTWGGTIGLLSFVAFVFYYLPAALIGFFSSIVGFARNASSSFSKRVFYTTLFFPFIPIFTFIVLERLFNQ